MQKWGLSQSHLPSVIPKLGISCISHAQGTPWMGTLRQASPTSTTFYLSSSRLWQAAYSTLLVLCIWPKEIKSANDTATAIMSDLLQTVNELNLLTATRNNFQRGPQCNSRWRYGLIKSFSIFSHKLCCHTMKKKVAFTLQGKRTWPEADMQAKDWSGLVRHYLICNTCYQCKVALVVGFGMRHAKIGFPLLLNQGLRTINSGSQLLLFRD